MQLKYNTYDGYPTVLHGCVCGYSLFSCTCNGVTSIFSQASKMLTSNEGIEKITFALIFSCPLSALAIQQVWLCAESTT